MNRRDFLTRAAMLAGQLAVDPEFLLWTPKPMITVPAPYLASYHAILGPVEDWQQALLHDLIHAERHAWLGPQLNRPRLV